MHLCVCEAVFVKEFCKLVCVCAQVPCGHVVCMSPRHPPALTVVCSSTGAISVDRLSSQNAFQLSAFQNNRHWCPRLFLQGPSATQRFNMPLLICWSVEGCMWCVCVCARVQDVMIMGGVGGLAHLSFVFTAAFQSANHSSLNQAGQLRVIFLLKWQPGKRQKIFWWEVYEGWGGSGFK